MNQSVLRIASYGARDLVRSRWLMGYATFFLAAGWGLLRFSDSETKALLSLVNVVLFVVPLATLVFGAMYLYASREFVELLLAQPVRRRDVFAGLYLGLTAPLAVAAVGGFALPLLLQGASAASIRSGVTLAALTVLLSAVFTGIAAVIAYSIDDRVRGLAAALGVGLSLAVIYDGVVLFVAVQLADYPLEQPMLAMMIANPIDLARMVLLLQFDLAALLGYTGAVFQRFFAAAPGAAIAAAALGLWTALPVIAGGRLFNRKDF
jgi:Cu-processing system permease protein